MMRIKKEAKGDNNNTEVYLEQNRKKQWIDGGSGAVCFMLYARSFYVTWGHREYWSWDCFEETGNENAEVAKLSHVCWLDIQGKLKTSDLSPGVVYDINFMVKLSKGASGWELPIKLQLSVPGQTVQVRYVSLLEKPKGEWVELHVGSFIAEENEHREVGFGLYEQYMQDTGKPDFFSKELLSSRRNSSSCEP